SHMSFGMSWWRVVARRGPCWCTLIARCYKQRANRERPFNLRKVLLLEKTSRYEFERGRYKYASLSEEDLRNLVRASSIAPTNGAEVRKVQRQDYCEDDVHWADAVISAGGDGTFLLAASKVCDSKKLVFGINTDPDRSEGYLCLPVHFTHNFPLAIHKLRSGNFRYCREQPVPVHFQQIPFSALNEVFIGESLSSRYKFFILVINCKLIYRQLAEASYYEISIDDGPWEKQKSSGINICTGSGSTAWSYNVNKVTKETVQDILKLGKVIFYKFCASLIFDPEEVIMQYSVREPIVNRVYSCTRPRGFAHRVSVRSRCWDACLVLDGAISFEFNDGAVATLAVNPNNALRTLNLRE
uniref:NAD kinase 2, mitochondrial n=1 Tax=Eptatretus burgeri TaxID=7764 RepID=A0A8C4QIY1_EPTBU